MTDAATPESSASLPEFNLLDSPWVPVRYLDGSTDELGLLDVFDRAAQIEGLAETSPPNLVALYRVLLAITHRALTLHLCRWTDRDRARWYAQGLPSGAVADYLTHWRDRFWLFHPEHPFMQVSALATAEETRDKLKPWTQIALASASGNNPVMFDHSLDTEPVSIDCAAALRWIRQRKGDSSGQRFCLATREPSTRNARVIFRGRFQKSETWPEFRCVISTPVISAPGS